MIGAVLLSALAAFLGYQLGVRRERGARERLVELTAEDVPKGGVRLRRVSVHR